MGHSEMIFYCQICGEQHTQPGTAQVTLTRCAKCGGQHFATWQPNLPALTARSEGLDRGDKLLQAKRSGYNEGFREGIMAAAKVAEGHTEVGYLRDCCENIAAEIRSLSPRETDADQQQDALIWVNDRLVRVQKNATGAHISASIGLDFYNRALYQESSDPHVFDLPIGVNEEIILEDGYCFYQIPIGYPPFPDDAELRKNAQPFSPKIVPPYDKTDDDGPSASGHTVKELPGAPYAEVAEMVRRLTNLHEPHCRHVEPPYGFCNCNIGPTARDAAALLSKVGAKAQVMHDLHDALGVRWGDDPYAEIKRLKSVENLCNDLLAQRPPPPERP